MVAIKKSNLFVCGGAIISSTKILTTASCIRSCFKVQNSTSTEECLKSWTIVTGSNSLSTQGNVYSVKDIKIPNNYVTRKFANDIGIITVNMSIYLILIFFLISQKRGLHI